MGLKWDRNKMNRRMYTERKFTTQENYEKNKWHERIETNMDGYDFRQSMILAGVHLNNEMEIEIDEDFLIMEIREHFKYKKSSAIKVVKSMKEKILSHHKDYQWLWDNINLQKEKRQMKERDFK